MLSFLSRLFSRSPWSNAERNIFRYWDGVRWRWGDPLAIQAALCEHGGDSWHERMSILRVANALPASASVETRLRVAREARAAVKFLVELSVAAFSVSRLDPLTAKGLTDTECVELLGNFMSYIVELVGEVRPLSPSPGPAASADSDTEPSVDSSSPKPTSDASEPRTSPTESTLPSDASVEVVMPKSE